MNTVGYFSCNFFFKIFLGNKESSDSKQACDAYDANDVADSTRVVDDNVSCDCKNKHLKGVRGGKVDEHACKLKTDYDGKHVV